MRCRGTVFANDLLCSYTVGVVFVRRVVGSIFLVICELPPFPYERVGTYGCRIADGIVRNIGPVEISQQVFPRAVGVTVKNGLLKEYSFIKSTSVI